MPKNGTSGTDQSDRIGEHVDEAAQSLMERGRAVANQLPEAVDGARGMIEAASSQMDGLSDQGVIAAVALSAGVAIGLFLGGAPRPILVLALLPTAITARSAMQRGVRASRLISPAGRRVLQD
jgi:hypothetical protein